MSFQSFLEPSNSKLGVVISNVVLHSDSVAMANTGKRLGVSNFSQKEVDFDAELH
jgi:hypothetical protein